MWIKVTVSGPHGRLVENSVDVSADGQVSETIRKAIEDYRRLYPESEPFEYEISVSKA